MGQLRLKIIYHFSLFPFSYKSANLKGKRSHRLNKQKFVDCMRVSSAKTHLVTIRLLLVILAGL